MIDYYIQQPEQQMTWTAGHPRHQLSYIRVYVMVTFASRIRNSWK